ncbi:MAG: hypothetical protein AAGA76_09605 [Pseudomonadota bacterium]
MANKKDFSLSIHRQIDGFVPICNSFDMGSVYRWARDATDETRNRPTSSRAK